MEEVWKDIDSYNGWYEVSNKGRIRSWKNCSSKDRREQPRILKNHIDRYGYEYVSIRKNNSPKKFKVHRLVAKAFIPEVDGKDQINHKNGVKTDNYVSNLEWCTVKENIDHAVNTGLREYKGEGNPSSNLTEQEVLDVRNTYRLGCFTQQEIADAFNVSRQIISAIVRRKVWKHV